MHNMVCFSKEYSDLQIYIHCVNLLICVKNTDCTVVPHSIYAFIVSSMHASHVFSASCPHYLGLWALVCLCLIRHYSRSNATTYVFSAFRSSYRRMRWSNACNRAQNQAGSLVCDYSHGLPHVDVLRLNSVTQLPVEVVQQAHQREVDVGQA